MIMKKPVTLEEVARLAGVSAKTVSRVVNNEAHVRLEKRQAVEKAIAETGYRPSMAARALASSRSYLICTISSWLESSYFQELHNQIIRACKACGYHLVIEEFDPRRPESLLELEKSLGHMRCEGVILTPPASDNDAVMVLLERMGVNYVRISPTQQSGRADAVSVDQAQGMRLMAEYLWSLGHRRYAVVWDPHPDAPMNRSALMAQILMTLGCAPDDIVRLDLNYRQGGLQAGRDCAKALLNAAVRPTAVFGYADEAAAGIVNYLSEHGLRVPDDFSVVGFDDFYIARLIWPPLTTIRVPLEEVAHKAVALLLEPTAAGQFRSVDCSVELIVRNSSSPPN